MLQNKRKKQPVKKPKQMPASDEEVDELESEDGDQPEEDVAVEKTLPSPTKRQR